MPVRRGAALRDIIGVATAVDLDVYILTTSDISAATAQQLIPKLTLHKDISFRGYKALPEAALESSGEAANVVAELAYLNTIIDAKAASGKTTVLIWRPATVAMMTASLTNVARAIANGVLYASYTLRVALWKVQPWRPSTATPSV